MDLISFIFLGLLKVNIGYIAMIFLGFLILIDFSLLALELEL